MTLIVESLLHRSKPCGCGFVEDDQVVFCPEHPYGYPKEQKEADTIPDDTVRKEL